MSQEQVWEEGKPKGDAETQQGGAEDLGGIASQSEIAQAGCDDGAFEGKCPIAHVLVFGLRRE